jgi:PIN domain nuclease of toxin-antitoxin system
MGGDKRLPAQIRELIADPENTIYISAASAWEMCIKLQTHPDFHLSQPLSSYFEQPGFVVIPIKLEHVSNLQKIGTFHKDPFDRLLIAQALVENLTLVTSDSKIWQYGDVTILRV